MKKIILFFLVIGFLSWGAPALSAQEEERPQEGQILNELQPKAPTYAPAGRRDPFKDLLSGREIKEKAMAGGVAQLSIDDINLIGIVKFKEKLTAIINGPQGFPYYLKVGDKMLDGFVLSMTETQVVFRKTSERGVPMMRPKDIVKEIYPEER